MSRGFGVWQRQILARLEREETFYLWELLPESHTATHRLACNRAAHRLQAMGYLTLRLYGQREGPGGQRHSALMVGRLGVTIDRWACLAWAWRRQGLSAPEIAERLMEWRGHPSWTEPSNDNT